MFNPSNVNLIKGSIKRRFYPWPLAHHSHRLSK